jgi:hypothetical protein
LTFLQHFLRTYNLALWLLLVPKLQWYLVSLASDVYNVHKYVYIYPVIFPSLCVLKENVQATTGTHREPVH